MCRAPLLFALLAAGPALAAPVPTAAPAPTPEAQQFATQLLAVAQQIHEDYVRVVPVADLLHAAVSGLYENARLRVPPDLKERLARAAEGNTFVLVLQHAYAETSGVVPPKDWVPQFDPLTGLPINPT